MSTARRDSVLRLRRRFNRVSVWLDARNRASAARYLRKGCYKIATSSRQLPPANHPCHSHGSVQAVGSPFVAEKPALSAASPLQLYLRNGAPGGTIADNWVRHWHRGGEASPATALSVDKLALGAKSPQDRETERDAWPLQDIVWSDMAYDAAKHHRRSIRLSGYDYRSPGAYFVTICIQGGESLLGEVVDGEMRLSEWGEVAAESWQWLDAQYPYISLDAWVIMPNHTHGIIVMQQHHVDVSVDRDSGGRGGGRRAGGRRGGSRTAPTMKRKPLGQLVGAFKTVSTKRINELRGTPGLRFWQRNYWEHIIRDEQSLNRIREYIQSNPARWVEDQLHPDAPPNAFNRWQPPEL